MSGYKYYHSFEDVNGIQHEIELWERGIILVSSTTINVAAPGYEIEWQGKGDALWQNPIKSSRCTIPFIVQNSTDETFFTSTLPTSPEETYDIVIRRDGSLFWVGTILCDQFSFDRKAIEGKLVVNVTAVDGLSRLQNFDLDFATGTQLRKDGITLLTEIFSKNGLAGYWGTGDVCFRDMLTIANTNKSITKGLANIQFNSFSFLHSDVWNSLGLFYDTTEKKPFNCKEALEFILLSCNLQIKHCNGAYYLTSFIQQGNSTANSYDHQSDGTFLAINTFTNGYTVNDGTANEVPVFLTTPVYSYQPPIKGMVNNVKKTNGKYTFRDTYSTSAIAVNSMSLVGQRNVRVRAEVFLDINNILDGYTHTVFFTIYATNGTTTLYYVEEDQTWSTSAQTLMSGMDSGIIGFRHDVETSFLPSGYTTISAQITVMYKRPAYFAYGKWYAATTGSQSFSGRLMIEESIQGSPALYNTTKKFISKQPGAKYNNSVYPSINTFLSNNQSVSSYYTPLVYDGTAWVLPGDWNDPNISGFTGDLPYLVNRINMAIYSDFLQTISGVLRDDSVYSAEKNISIDGAKWVFNGGTYNADVSQWDGEWLKIDATVEEIEDEEELVVKDKKKDTDQIFDDVNGLVGKLRKDIKDIKTRVVTDIINDSDGSPTSDPLQNMEWVVKLKYDNTTKTVNTALEERENFNAFNGTWNCGNAETDYSDAIGIKLGRAQ